MRTLRKTTVTADQPARAARRKGEYGLIAEFTGPEPLVEATKRAYEVGYRRLDAYTPFPVHGLAEAMGRRGIRIPLIVLAGGIAGGLGGFLLQTYGAVFDYPNNIGGRPLFSWPAFIPITFELTILGAVFAAVFGLLALNGLPQPHHPVFNAPNFEMASRSHFFLCIEAADPRYDNTGTRKFLEGLGPMSVSEVPY
ncbi:MAG TPA: DUF3341 domain-containing protein [Roseiflexaceae bacterium]|nr:DUF3341 domain-containing protein [Roseiflexaceae bacterium]